MDPLSRLQTDSLIELFQDLVAEMAVRPRARTGEQLVLCRAEIKHRMEHFEPKAQEITDAANSP